MASLIISLTRARPIFSPILLSKVLPFTARRSVHTMDTETHLSEPEDEKEAEASQNDSNSKNNQQQSSGKRDSLVIKSFTPHSSDGYYATNNQFQCSGPKGFTEFKLLVNDDLYVRVDLPGVVKETLRYWTHPDKKLVYFEGEAPQESELDEGGRSYLGASGLICDCCEISNLKAGVRDGVLRMVISKVKINKDGKSSKETPCPGGPKSSDGSGPVLQDHPHVIKGPKGAFEAKPMEDGGLYARIDLPGVAKGDESVWFKDGEVRFFGFAQNFIEHDQTGREYLGSLACSKSLKIGKIKFQMKNGILRITIACV